MTDPNAQLYNTFKLLPSIPYNIISYLIANDDFVWKLLQYNSPDAWKDSTPNLTQDQKRALVYDGLKVETDCRVFSDAGQDMAWRVEATILRIAVLEFVPTNYVIGNMSIALQIYTHYAVGTLSNYQNRNLAIAQRLLELLNGTEIGGVGKFFFDRRANSNCKASLIGAIPYKGFQVVMANNIM